MKNIDIIDTVRKDTAIYGLKPEPTAKRGRPKTKGDKLDYRKFSKLKFQSLQEIKYYISDCISKELIYGKLLKTMQLDKNITTFEDVIEHLHNHALAS
ncbi:hypothetical protein [Clostridium tarantellae]|uniref:Uncharacterized protein n=1 Tax=Clostridium tarantellae TaxID=39493 RepID=A0A6I1MIX1_9CLOT|nr:hypothetical protein [Clostridium tarantellae]MPQ42874.1 hypothetical protein [Clostridium tarantellae]